MKDNLIKKRVENRLIDDVLFDFILNIWLKWDILIGNEFWIYSVLYLLILVLVVMCC